LAQIGQVVAEISQIQFFAKPFHLGPNPSNLDSPYLCNHLVDLLQILESVLIFCKVYEQRDDAN